MQIIFVAVLAPVSVICQRCALVQMKSAHSKGDAIAEETAIGEETAIAEGNAIAGARAIAEEDSVAEELVMAEVEVSSVLWSGQRIGSGALNSALTTVAQSCGASLAACRNNPACFRGLQDADHPDQHEGVATFVDCMKQGMSARISSLIQAGVESEARPQSMTDEVANILKYKYDTPTMHEKKGIALGESVSQLMTHLLKGDMSLEKWGQTALGIGSTLLGAAFQSLPGGPFLAPIAVTFASFLSGLLFGPKKCPMQELYEKMMEAMKEIVMKTRVEDTMRHIKDQLKVLVEELSWIPALLENQDQSTKLSWYLILQNDLSKYSFYAFGRCADEHYAQDCRLWQQGGGLEVSVLYVGLYQALMAEIVLIDNTLANAIADRLEVLREKWKPLLSDSYNEWFKDRPSHVHYRKYSLRCNQGNHMKMYQEFAYCYDERVTEWKSPEVSTSCAMTSLERRWERDAHVYCDQRKWWLKKQIKDGFESQVNEITGAAPAPSLGHFPDFPPPPKTAPAPQRRRWQRRPSQHNPVEHRDHHNYHRDSPRIPNVNGLR